MLHSSNTVNKGPAIVAGLWRRALPDPGPGPSIDLVGGQAARAFNFGVVSKSLPS